MNGKRNGSVCRGHELANALYHEAGYQVIIQLPQPVIIFLEALDTTSSICDQKESVPLTVTSGNFGYKAVWRGTIKLYRGMPTGFFRVVGEEGDFTLADVGG